MRHLGWALAAFLLMTSSVYSATVYITPRIAAVLNEDFSPVDPSSIIFEGCLAFRPSGYYLLQVDVEVKTEGLGGSAVGFSNTAFNSAVHGTGASLYFDEALGISAWTPYNPQFDSNGPAIGGVVNKWDINSDDGAPNDLQGVILAGITQGFGPSAYDVRRTLTQGQGDHAGTFYIKFDGLPGSSAAAEILAAFGASTYDANGESTTAGNVAVGGTTDRFQCVPEPPSLALLAVGLASWRRRRHQYKSSS